MCPLYRGFVLYAPKPVSLYVTIHQCEYTCRSLYYKMRRSVEIIQQAQKYAPVPPSSLFINNIIIKNFIMILKNLLLIRYQYSVHHIFPKLCTMYLEEMFELIRIRLHRKSKLLKFFISTFYHSHKRQRYTCGFKFECTRVLFEEVSGSPGSLVG